MEASERRVAVVGEDDRAATVRDAVRALDFRAVDGVNTDTDASADTETGPSGGADTDALADADAVVAVGEEAIREVLVGAPTAPVVLVGRRRLALDVESAERCLRQLVDGPVTRSDADDDDGLPPDGLRRVTHPVLGVDDGSGRGPRAVFDVALVTDEPARISEFSVSLPRGGDESFRADGIVVATPLGSDAYANAAGGALVEPGGGLSLVPIAPFSTRTDAWIAADGATLSVERGSEPVALVVDGAVRGAVEPHRPVDIEVIDRVEVAIPSLSAPRRARRSETL
ncbi:MAG: ATP-NAD kinase [Halorubrum sp.]